VRSLGFGAGMGLPNMRRNADEFFIQSTVGVGTEIHMGFSQAAR
ncbi:MAG: anti-sigma regulatory factor, partial [Clostridiales bacterium]|nr:anti-sigma regulatory factor [Clostridiales bacterium]